MSDGQDFGVGRGIVRSDTVIVTPPDNLAVYQQNGSSGDFTFGFGSAGLRQRLAHPEFRGYQIHVSTGVEEWESGTIYARAIDSGYHRNLMTGYEIPRSVAQSRVLSGMGPRIAS